MTAKIINGKKIANKILNKVSKKIKFLKKINKNIPGLAIILIGNNKASDIYVKKKYLACKKVGIIYYLYKFNKYIKEYKLLKLIKKLNKNNKIDGILIQLPLPKNINNNKILKSISINKDVDGLHPYNIGCLYQKIPNIRPCTSSAIMTIIKKLKINIRGLNAVIVGASNIVGKPISMELLLSGCTITITHKLTKNLKYYIKNADLLIVAIGHAHFIPGNWIKFGAIVIDVGINFIKNNKIVGDIDFHSALKKASYITPVPGGVGPVTVATLIKNTLYAYKKNKKYKKI